jgi:hypothetical protein
VHDVDAREVMIDRLLTNIGVEMDLRKITAEAAKIKVQGERLPEAALKMTGR